MGWKKAKCASHQSKVEFPIIKGRTPSRLGKWYNFYFFFQIKSYFVGQPKVSLIPLCNFFLWHFSDLSFSGWGSLKSLKQGFKVSWMGWDTYWHPFQFHRKSHPMKYFAFLNQTLFLFSYDVSGFWYFINDLHFWLLRIPRITNWFQIQHALLNVCSLDVMNTSRCCQKLLTSL